MSLRGQLCQLTRSRCVSCTLWWECPHRDSVIHRVDCLWVVAALPVPAAESHLSCLSSAVFKTRSCVPAKLQCLSAVSSAPPLLRAAVAVAGSQPAVTTPPLPPACKPLRAAALEHLHAQLSKHTPLRVVGCAYMQLLVWRRVWGPGYWRLGHLRRAGGGQHSWTWPMCWLVASWNPRHLSKSRRRVSLRLARTLGKLAVRFRRKPQERRPRRAGPQRRALAAAAAAAPGGGGGAAGAAGLPGAVRGAAPPPRPLLGGGAGARRGRGLVPGRVSGPHGRRRAAAALRRQFIRAPERRRRDGARARPPPLPNPTPCPTQLVHA